MFFFQILKEYLWSIQNSNWQIGHVVTVFFSQSLIEQGLFTVFGVSWNFSFSEVISKLLQSCPSNDEWFLQNILPQLTHLIGRKSSCLQESTSHCCPMSGNSIFAEIVNSLSVLKITVIFFQNKCGSEKALSEQLQIVPRNSRKVRTGST